jgi:hypothetical protein
MKNIFEGAREVRTGANAEQFLDVQYTDLVRDPLSTVRRIYNYHRYEYSDHFEEAMKQWLIDNRQHKHGTPGYTLEEYGLDAVGVRSEFTAYCEEFDL